MTPAPRSDVTPAAALRFVLEVVLFTVAATLVVGVSTLLVAATLSLAGSVTDSRTVSSLLALLVFFCYLGVPAYLLATRVDADGDGADNGDGTGDGADNGDGAGNGDGTGTGDSVGTGDGADNGDGGTPREKRE